MYNGCMRKEKCIKFSDLLCEEVEEAGKRQLHLAEFDGRKTDQII